jgi:serine/threonine-protein kinase
MTPTDPTGRDLLLGMLALQTGLADPPAVVAAFHAWGRDPGRSMGDVLLERGAIDASRRRLLEDLLATFRRGGPPGDADPAATGPAGPGRPPDGDATTEADATPAAPGAPPGGREDAPGGARFRILRPHASGGLGVVSVALDTELNREVALKQIRDALADDPNSRSRFLTEAEVTGALEHPGIVPVYGLGRDATGRPYYAMRFVRGETLRSAIETFHADAALRADPGRRSLELRKLLRRLLDACNAIDYAHGRGVLHRDIKPANILVGKHGETLVVDWGLAKATGRRDPTEDDEHTVRPVGAGGSSAETRPGSALGTPAFMSPEQAAGALDRLGPRSDVYSLGATLYALLTGRRPFEGEDLPSLLDAVRRGDFPPPRQVDRRIPPALEAVCLKAMATRPADRYASARELAEDLERWMADAPVAARREGVPTRLARWARRHKPLVAASGVLLVALSLALGVGNALLGRANREVERQRDEARRQGVLASENFRKARLAVDRFFTRVSEEQLLGQPGLLPLRRQLLNEALSYYEGFLAERSTDPTLRRAVADARGRVGDIAGLLGKTDEARANLRLAVDQFEALHADFPDDPEVAMGLARALFTLAYQEVYADAYDAGEALASRAILLLARGPESLADARDASYLLARSHALIGLSKGFRGRFRDGLVPNERATVLLEALVRESPADLEARQLLARVCVNQGGLLEGLGQVAEAGRSHARGIEVQRSLVAAQPLHTRYREGLAIALTSLAKQELARGRPTRALAAGDEAEAIADLLVRENPGAARAAEVLGQAREMRLIALRRLGRAVEARAQLPLLIGPAGPPDGPAARVDLLSIQANARAQLAHLESAEGRPAEARRAWDDCLELLDRIERQAPDDDGYRAEAIEAREERTLLDARDDGPGAIATMQGLLARREELRRRDPESPRRRLESAVCRLRLARLRREHGAPDEAAATLAAAREALAALAREAPDVATYRARLAEAADEQARLERRRGDLDAALREARSAVAQAEAAVADEPSEGYALAAYLAHAAELHPGGDDAARAVGALAALEDFDHVDRLGADPALAPLRPLPEFRAVRDRVAARAESRRGRDGNGPGSPP